MLDLNAGQEVDLYLADGTIYSNIAQLICFNGIYYDPASPDLARPMQKVAWSLQRDASLTAPDSNLEVTFDSIEVNEGSAYNETTNEITISVPGYYFMHVNAGALSGLRVDMRIMRNSTQEAVLRRDSTTHQGVDTLGRSVLAYLDRYDVITVEIGEDSGVFSNVNHQTSFTGFLIVNR